MESITVIIKTPDGQEEYLYEGNLKIPVTSLLERINVENDIRIHFSSSCLQGLCGSCAMIINGWPKLACKTFVDEEIITKKEHRITIEPLSKFQSVRGLVVDRTVMFENLKDAHQWLEEDAEINEDNLEFEYEVSQCLMCGCCLEVCPNYDGKDEYYGAILPVSSSKIFNQESDGEKLRLLKESYNNHFYSTCVKSLSCEDVCPMGIQTQRAISIMNRYSIWKFRNLLKNR